MLLYPIVIYKDDMRKLQALQLFKEVDSDLCELHTCGKVLGEALEFGQARKAELRELQDMHYHQHHSCISSNRGEEPEEQGDPEGF
jgi:hypothetical protein